MLSREEFDQIVLNRFQELLPEIAGEGSEAVLRENVKINDTMRKGIMVTASGNRISPTIYLEEYYDKYRRGESIDRIIMQLGEAYEHVKDEQTISAWDMDMSYEKIREHLIFQVVNMKANKKLLAERPYHALGNGMAMVYDYVLKMEGEQIMYLGITREHVQRFGYEMEEIQKDAVANTVKVLPAQLGRMEDILLELTANPSEQWTGMRSLDRIVEEIEQGDDSFIQGREFNMLVLSNPLRNLGASCLYYPGVQEKIGKALGENYYVLPSSLHELILLPESIAFTAPNLNLIVAEVNAAHVRAEEYLGDRVLFYNRETKELTCPADPDRDKARGRRNPEMER